VYRAASEVDESTVVIAKALKSLRTKATNVETSLDTIIDLTSQQQAVLDTAQGQISTLSQLSKTLVGIDTALHKTVDGFNASNAATTSLATRIENIVKDGADSRKVLESSLNGIAEKLNAGAVATEAVAVKLERATIADVETAKSFRQHTSTVIGKVEKVVEQLQSVATHFSIPDAVLGTSSASTKVLPTSIRSQTYTDPLTNPNL